MPVIWSSNYKTSRPILSLLVAALQVFKFGLPARALYNSFISDEFNISLHKLPKQVWYIHCFRHLITRASTAIILHTYKQRH